jgi:hypothetical protein
MDNRFLSEKADNRVLYTAMIPDETGARVNAACSVAYCRISPAVHACRIVELCARALFKVEQSRLTPGLIPLNYSADKALLPAE